MDGRAGARRTESVFMHKRQCYKEYLRISAIRTSSDRCLLKRESVAGSDASAVHLQHATESSVHFRLNTLLGGKGEKMTVGYGVGKL